MSNDTLLTTTTTTTTSAPSTPMRSSSAKHESANNHNNHNNVTPTRPRMNSRDIVTPQRPRMNSRDIPRTYSGLFGAPEDLLPFELAQNQHTDWLENGGWLLLGTYLGGIAVFEILGMAVLDTLETIPLYWSWTATNAAHCVLTTIYLHWLKGSMFDKQGELSAMTLWEQLEGRPKTSVIKRTLTIVPTLLCYAACHFSNYDYDACKVNIVLWSIHVMAKLPIMNGVRIFGINRTEGIDDFGKKLE